MKLAVLIADGLPEPRSIGFNSQSNNLVSIDFDDNEPAFTAWCRAIGAQQNAAHPNSDGSKWLHTAYQWQWHGWTVQMVAASPRVEAEPPEPPTDDDLTKVREIAEGSS